MADLNESLQKMEAAYIKMECDREALSIGNEFAVLSQENAGPLYRENSGI